MAVQEQGSRPLSEELAEVCRRHRIAFLYLFGSQAEMGVRLLSGEKVSFTDPLTDLDVGVVFLDGLPAQGRGHLYATLYNDLVDVFAPLPVDLCFLEEMNSVFVSEAFTGHCAYAYDLEARFVYEERILARAADFLPFLQQYLREALAEGTNTV